MKTNRFQIICKYAVKIFPLTLLSILLVSCNKSSEYVDENWEFGEFLSYTSSALSTPPNEQSMTNGDTPMRDLSNIGFRNRMGMDEWLSIDGFSENDMYVYREESGISNGRDWFTFTDKYLYRQDSNSDGNKSSKPGRTYVINILDNDAISLPSDYENYRITERITNDINKNFCVIKSVYTDTFDGKTQEYWFTPIDLIDWNRSPEKITDTRYRYYFKK